VREIPAFIEAAATRGNVPEYAEVLTFCEQNCFSPEFFSNEFSILVAKGFADGKLSYEFCDEAMNYLWGVITTPPVFGPDKNIPEPAFAIYQAFDEGEYYHLGDNREVEPMEKYTRPKINQILRGLNAS
jgi:hypothetical protein